ncbi:sperm flagellar protein 2-like, partial [Argonauta hians]
IPLINATAIRQSTATATEQKKFFKEGNEELTETAEKHIIEAFHHSYNQAHTEIDNIVAAEQAIRESEEEEERRKMQEKERERLHYEKIQKNKEKKSTKKGSTTKGKKEPEVTTPPPSFEISEEEKIQKNRREKLRREYYHAVETEEAAVKYRLEQIRRYAQTQVFASLQATAERTYRPIKECIGSRFLQQIESIDKMAEVMKNAIENGEKLKKELVLENEEFYINEEYLTQRISVEIIPEFTEQNSNQMTCVQLCAFLTQFQLSAPSGYISTKCFQEILEDLVFTSHGISALPKNWILPNLAQVQHNIQFLSKKVSNNTNLINWRQFIMWASYPFPLLSLTELHHLYLAYSNQDPNHTGYITYEIFNSVPFWSDEDIEKHNASYKFDRSSKLKDIFFDLFSEVNDCPIPIINYVNMLLYFCSMPFVFDGFKRAVILLCFGERVREEGLTEITSSELLIETKDNSKEATEVYVETAEEEVGIEISSTTGSQLVSEGEVDYSFKKIHSYPESRYTYNINQPIPIHIMLQALNHGVPPRNEYLENIDSDERVTLTELEEVYDCLGAKDGEPLPFESLMAHPLIQDTVSRSNNYRMMDIRNILYSASPVSSS